MILFSEKKLAKKLQSDSVTEKDQLIYFLLTNLGCAILTSHLGSHHKTSLAQIDDNIDDALSICYLIINNIYTFVINRRGDNQKFLSRYICLGIPIMIKAGLLVMLLVTFVELNALKSDLVEPIIELIVYSFCLWRYRIAFLIASSAR